MFRSFLPFTFWKQDTDKLLSTNTSTNDGAKQQQQQQQQKQNKADKTKVISMNQSEEADDFVEVDIKKLSYAEVAALSRTNGSMGKVCGNHCAGKQKRPTDEDIVDECDLESEVTDYQMSKILSEHVSRKQQQAAFDSLNVNVKGDNLVGVDSLVGLDDDYQYNDKSHRRTKKAKFLKKGK